MESTRAVPNAPRLRLWDKLLVNEANYLDNLTEEVTLYVVNENIDVILKGQISGRTLLMFKAKYIKRRHLIWCLRFI